MGTSPMVALCKRKRSSENWPRAGGHRIANWVADSCYPGQAVVEFVVLGNGAEDFDRCKGPAMHRAGTVPPARRPPPPRSRWVSHLGRVHNACEPPGAHGRQSCCRQVPAPPARRGAEVARMPQHDTAGKLLARSVPSRAAAG